MIAVSGSTVSVRVMRQAARGGAEDMIATRRVNIISAGPPGIVAAWGVTLDGKREYLLVRKAKDGTFYAFEGDRG